MERLAPLEERIRDELVIKIKRGDYAPSCQLPSEADLAGEFEVSRATIRAALSLLAAQGLIVRKHGSGTYVNNTMLSLRLRVGEQWEFDEMIRSSGYKAGITFLDAEILPADEEQVAGLGINPGEDTLKVRKVFTADGVPAIYSLNYLSLQLAPPPHNLKKLRGPIFPFLLEEYGLAPIYSVTDIYPVVAGNVVGGLLQVGPLTPLLFFKDVFFSAANQPILYTHNYFTELLHYQAIRKPDANLLV